MKILFTGPLRSGSLTESRLQALIALGHNVDSIDQVPYLVGGIPGLGKLRTHLHLGPKIRSYNRSLRKVAIEQRPDLIYIDQAGYLYPSAVIDLRKTTPRLIHYTSEYLGFRSYWYRHFWKTVSIYDAHVITNLLNEPLLLSRGARRLVRTHFGYDPAIHRPFQLTDDERLAYATDVVFVGHWEPETEARLAHLRSSGLEVRIWGPGWRRARQVDGKGIRPVFGDEYVKCLVGAKICLCLLSKWNFNQSASRTFEIPAVGGFLLAERTEDHLSYFKEGVEAEFFGSGEELREKVVYYLNHEHERERIAKAGHERCMRSPYRHMDRMSSLMVELEQL